MPQEDEKHAEVRSSRAEAPCRVRRGSADAGSQKPSKTAEVPADNSVRRVFLAPDDVEPGIRHWKAGLSEPDAEPSASCTVASEGGSDTAAAGVSSGPQLFDLTLDDLDDEEAEFFPECHSVAQEEAGDAGRQQAAQDAEDWGQGVARPHSPDDLWEADWLQDGSGQDAKPKHREAEEVVAAPQRRSQAAESAVKGTRQRHSGGRWGQQSDE